MFHSEKQLDEARGQMIITQFILPPTGWITLPIATLLIHFYQRAENSLKIQTWGPVWGPQPNCLLYPPIILITRIYHFCKSKAVKHQQFHVVPINVFHKIWEHYSHSSFKLFFVHWFLLSFWNSHCKYFRILDYHISLWGSFFNIVSFLSFNIVSYYSLDWIIAFDSS